MWTIGRASDETDLHHAFIWQLQRDIGVLIRDSLESLTDTCPTQTSRQQKPPVTTKCSKLELDIQYVYVGGKNAQSYSNHCSILWHIVHLSQNSTLVNVAAAAASVPSACVCENISAMQLSKLEFLAILLSPLSTHSLCPPTICFPKWSVDLWQLLHSHSPSLSHPHMPLSNTVAVFSFTRVKALG